MSIMNTPDFDQNQESTAYPYNGKVLLAAVILLSIVVFFIILLHIYARWFLTRQPNIILQSLTSIRDRIDEVTFFSKGLDAKIVASLPKFVYEKKEGANASLDCVVCLSVIEEGEVVRALNKCEHVFHVECVDKWLMSHSTCPICRGRVELVMDDDVAEAQVIGRGAEETEDSAAIELSQIIIKDACESPLSLSSSSSLSSSTLSMASSSSSCTQKKMVSKSSRSENKVFPAMIVS